MTADFSIVHEGEITLDCTRVQLSASPRLLVYFSSAKI